LKSRPCISIAGQITGVEGYIESAAIGLLVGRLVGSKVLGKRLLLPEPTTAMGALASHILTKNKNYQPMNVNFGLFKQDNNNPKGRRNRSQRYLNYTQTAKIDFIKWLNNFQEFNFNQAS
jgi:methylenetetrahydrofolate--tRNA-(uracil-5-)-methyltransferase